MGFYSHIARIFVLFLSIRMPASTKNKAICQFILIFHVDLRLRSNPSDPSSQELDATDDFVFPSSSSQQKLLCNLIYLTVLLILCK